MSSNKSLTLVKNVKPFKTGWCIQVKVLHSWRQFTTYGGHSLELILADETGTKIHCSCKKDHMFRVQRDMPLGVWRLITNFSLSNATGHYRSTNHPFKMTITGETKIAKSDFHCDDMFFTFATYEDAGNGSIDARFLIEVIGQVESIKDVQTVQVKGQDKKKVEFRLRDTKGDTIACCLWGKFAEQIEAYVQEKNDPNMILIIRFAKIGFYKGEVQLTNAFDASVLLIDPDLDEVNTFRSMLPQNGTGLTLFDPNANSKAIKVKKQDWNEVQIKAISEILMAMKVENCKVIVSIEAIDTDRGWFYFGHDRCNKRATQIGWNDQANKPLWRCERCRCNVTNVSPKYKLHIVVQDDSGTCKLLLLDTEAQAIVGCETVGLWDGSYDEIEDPDVLPEPVREIVGKSFCFGIALANNNVANGSDIFMVMQIWSGDRLLTTFSQSDSFPAISSGSSMISSAEVSKLDPNSQTTSEGCSTHFSKRKDDDLPDITSSSKKLCTKIVKVENRRESSLGKFEVMKFVA